MYTITICSTLFIPLNVLYICTLKCLFNNIIVQNVCELASVYYPVKVQNILNYISLNFLILNRNDNLCFTNSLTLAMKLSELKDCKCFVKVLDAANALFALLPV